MQCDLYRYIAMFGRGIMDKLDLVVSAIEQGSFYSHNGNMEEAKKYDCLSIKVTREALLEVLDDVREQEVSEEETQ